MKKIVKTVLLACLVILPLFALSACSSRSHFATQKDQWQTYTKEKKIKIGFVQPLFLWDMRKRMVAILVLILTWLMQFLIIMASMLNGKLLTGYERN